MKKSLHTFFAGLCLSTAIVAQPTGTAIVTGPSSSQSPYLLPTINNMTITSILTAANAVGGYSMSGLADGTGAYDNGDGTFTLLMNHEIGGGAGGTRAHGANGAFVSKWVINKSTLAVVSGTDLIQSVYLNNGGTYSLAPANSFTRFCSADLPAVSAFYNAANSLGTQNRIFMNGEEAGNEGKAMAHVATGPAAGNSYELPYLGKASWENAVACPNSGTKTVVGLLDDSSPGQVYMYVGTKTNSGLDIERAGLTNGKLYGIAVTGLLAETNGAVPPANTTFSLVDLGQVNAITGSSLNTMSNNMGVTTFLRPEDGDWSSTNVNDFYFVTTNAFGSNSRMWRLRFTNITTPELGGTITAVLDGSEGQQMLDNIGMAKSPNIVMVEDVGGNAHNGKVWNYNIATDVSTIIAQHDPTRFITGGVNFLTQDEEASGPIDMESILGTGYFLLVDQAHYSIGSPIVEGGQIMVLFNPMAAPEINVQGNGSDIADGSIATSPSNFTDFGISNVGQTVNKTFAIQNNGFTNLVITSASLTGANASDFSFVAIPAMPFTVTPGSQQPVTVQFNPGATGSRSATVTFNNNDVTEKAYDYAVAGTGTTVTTGIASNSKNVSFVSVYPNPAKDEAVVSMTFEKNESVTLNVIDLQGKKVMTPVVKNFDKGDHTVTINTSILANGTYFVQVTKSGKPLTVKLVVNH